MSLQHIAIIMDGNGRWAKERGLSRSEGHKAGSKAVRELITKARQLNLPYLTLYALSRENLQRPAEELKNLFALLVDFVSAELPTLLENDIKLHYIGDIDALPFASQKAFKYALNKTKKCKSMNLCLALAYSAREEIMRAIVRMSKENNISDFSPTSSSDMQILLQEFQKHLDAPTFPDPDMIIRTGGDTRISNFLLFQAAYSEFYFTPLYFPDFGADDLQKAIDDFSSRTRRFGKTDEQVQGEVK